MIKKKLHELRPGDKGIVSVIEADSQGRRRMLDMGLVKGAEIRVVRMAPFGDPMEFEIKGYHLSLRKREAKAIEVEVNE